MTAATFRNRVSITIADAIADVRMTRADYVDTITESVYRRMEAERKRVANELRSTGGAEGEKIRADAPQHKVRQHAALRRVVAAVGRVHGLQRGNVATQLALQERLCVRAGETEKAEVGKRNHFFNASRDIETDHIWRGS